MKKQLLFISFFLLCGTILFAQSVGINDDCSAPNSHAILDLKSSSKGFLPPRMTTAEINAISPIPEGLNVYNSSLHTMVFYDGTDWKKSDGTPMTFSVGQSYGGGIVFYVDGSGQHGLIAATSDQSSSAEWGCNGIWMTGTFTAIGTGQANTTAIVNGCAQAGIAARICDNLILNGYSDWYLPSKDELNLLYLNQVTIGGFVGVFYWSSSEDSANTAASQIFTTGAVVYSNKFNTCSVRAIRSF